MSSVALVVPAIRMAIVAVSIDDDDIDADPSCRYIHPIIAIRSILDADGECQEDLLILDDVEDALIMTVDEAYPRKGYRRKVVVCDWPPGQDSERLGQIATRMAAACMGQRAAKDLD